MVEYFQFGQILIMVIISVIPLLVLVVFLLACAALFVTYALKKAIHLNKAGLLKCTEKDA